ncbi:MAG: TetR/AcrR family transcriptional regulator [Myxococcota bacterium]|nr:TetR/AcrR family transcriptional regulator [Myxococcota bacterium]
MPNERSFSGEGGGEPPAPAKSTSKPRAKRSDRGHPDKRERILRAAIRVFARKGFYATRVNEIAKAAGVADGTIYLYFKNKDDVLVSIFEDRITKLIAVLRSELEVDAAFDVKFRRVIELQLGLLEGQRDLAEVVTVNLRQSSRLLKQFATPLFTQYLDVIAGLVAQGQREGVVREDINPRVLARALWGALDGVAVTWALSRPGSGGEPGQLQKAATQVASVFLDGVRARAGNA